MRTLLTPLALLLLAAPAFAGLSPSTPVTSLGSPGGHRIPADAANFGQVAYSDTSANPATPAFLDVSGGTGTPGVTRSRNSNSSAWLNNAGRVAAYGGTPGSHSCLYADSLMMDFEVLGGSSGYVYGISDGGQVASAKTRGGKSGSDADPHGNGGTGEPGTPGGADNSGSGDKPANGANPGTGINFGNGGNGIIFGNGVSFGNPGSGGSGGGNASQASGQGDTGGNPPSRPPPSGNGGGNGGATPGGNQGGGTGGNNGGQAGGNGGGGGGSTSRDILTDGSQLPDLTALLYPLTGLTSEGPGGTHGTNGGDGQPAGLDCIGQCDASLPTRSDPIAVPEPGSLALFSLALAAMAASALTRKRKPVPARSLV
jgi:hypothetical protein